MEVKFKKLDPKAVVPFTARHGDAGLDITATTRSWSVLDKLYVYGTGLAVEIPEGYVGLMFPRSSICRTPFVLSNSVGVIDSGYRGEITFKFSCVGTVGEIYHPGDRIGQLVIIPIPKIIPIEGELSDSERGTGGYGSSGR